MPGSPQDVYARHLLSPRGYPLWIPEPSHQLLVHRRDGLRIGDVGVVVPEDGGFDVFFNLCLPREHPFHQATGVPDGFSPLQLRDIDIRSIPGAENAGRIISNSSVKRVRKVEPGGNDSSRSQAGSLRYEFNLSSSEGALLILPEGAERHDLRNHQLFFEEAARHGADWYRFAEEHVGQILSHDSLYVITGLHKTRSWSLAAFENAAGSGEFSAQFKVTHVGGNDIAAAYTWETTPALEWRVGPIEHYGIPNQSVFIRGFKIALRSGLLGRKWISVEAGAPSARLNQTKFSSPIPQTSWISNVWQTLWGGANASGTGTHHGVTTPSESADITATQHDVQVHGSLEDTNVHVEIQRIPEVSPSFHPSDLINEYLLSKEPSANVAITHDDVWCSMLEKELILPDELMLTDRLRAVLSKNYEVVSRNGIVFLKGRTRSDIKASSDVVPDTQAMIDRVTLERSSILVAESQQPAGKDNLLDVITELQMHLGIADDAAYRAQSECDSETNNPRKKANLAAQKGSENLTLYKTSQGKIRNPYSPPLRMQTPSEFELHWQLLPYSQRRSKGTIWFDVAFPVDRIRFQHSSTNNVKVSKPDLDKPASNVFVTTMPITYREGPFYWSSTVTNQNGVRCRDVFEDIYRMFNQPLTPDERMVVPNPNACEDGFQLRCRLSVDGKLERELGWKRVDVILNRSLFLGLTKPQPWDGSWLVNVGKHESSRSQPRHSPKPAPSSGISPVKRHPTSSKDTIVNLASPATKTAFHAPSKAHSPGPAVSHNEALPQHQHQHFSSLHATQTPCNLSNYSAPQFNIDTANPNPLLSPGDPVSVGICRAKSDGGRRFRDTLLRVSLSVEDVTSSLPYPPSRQSLYPKDTAPPIRGGHNSRESSGSHGGGRSCSPLSSNGPSPYPNTSARPSYEALPNIPLNGRSPSRLRSPKPNSGAANAVPKRSVMIERTTNASHNRRKQDVNLLCPAPGCGYTFVSRFALESHMIAHHGEGPFQSKSHSTHRRFTCGVCNKTFSRMDALDQHLLSEAGCQCIVHPAKDSEALLVPKVKTMDGLA